MSRSIQSLNSLVETLTLFLHNDILLYNLTLDNIDIDVCFDCTIWNEGFICYYENCDEKVIIKPIKITFKEILTELEFFIRQKLSDCENSDYALKSQLDRLLSIITDLRNKVIALSCIDNCNDIDLLPMLFTTLVQTILKLITVIETLNSVLAYSESCGCLGLKIYDINMGIFINSITTLQQMLVEWNSLVMSYFHYSSMTYKSYVASYVPNPVIPQPKPIHNMSHACVPCPPEPNIVNLHPNICSPINTCIPIR